MFDHKKSKLLLKRLESIERESRRFLSLLDDHEKRSVEWEIDNAQFCFKLIAKKIQDKEASDGVLHV